MQLGEPDLQLQLLPLGAGEHFASMQLDLRHELLLAGPQLLGDVSPLLVHLPLALSQLLLLAGDGLGGLLQIELFGQLPRFLLFAGGEPFLELRFGLLHRLALLFQLFEPDFQLGLLLGEGEFALRQRVLLFGKLAGLFGELGLPVVMVERAGLQFSGEPLLVGDYLQLGRFPFLPLAGELLLLFGQLLAGCLELRLGGLLLFALADESFMLD